MIHVQIARDITTIGVEGVRWVLVEPSEAAVTDVAAPAVEPADVAAAEAAVADVVVPDVAVADLAARDVAAVDGTVLAPVPLAAVPPDRLQTTLPAPGSGMRVHLWQMAIIGLGLLAALGTAQRQLGLPTLPRLGVPEPSLPLATPAPVLVVPAAPAAPAANEAAPAAPAPADLEARPQADLPTADNPELVPAEPAASASRPERLITAGLR